MNHVMDLFSYPFMTLYDVSVIIHMGYCHSLVVGARQVKLNQSINQSVNYKM